MKNAVKETIRQTILKHSLIQQKSHVITGLSGGPDSVCLFHVLRELREELDFSLCAVHVNHKFRPGEAEGDQAYVEALCRAWNIPCRVVVRDCGVLAKELGISGEEAGRKARYDAFSARAGELVRSGIPAERVKIAVAQNADDQAETILLRLLRGTGADGLAGISYDRPDGRFHIIRPLLDVWRSDVEAYCREKGLEPRIDRTNLQPIYTRNKIRLRLLPYLRDNFNPGIGESLIRLGNAARQDKEYLWDRAEAAYQELLREAGGLDPEGLRKLEPPIRRRVIMKAFQQAGLTRDIAAVHLESADRLLEKGKAPASLDFPGSFTMAFEKNAVRFYSKTEKPEKREAAPGFGAPFGEVLSPDGSSSQKSEPRTLFTGKGAIKLRLSLTDPLPPASDASTKAPIGASAHALIDASAGASPRRDESKKTASQTSPPASKKPASPASLPASPKLAEADSGPKVLHRAAFDRDKLQAACGPDPQIRLRTRQPGDYIRLKQGKKKLQDFFVDQKIPREQRDFVPLAAAGNDVLWIIALEDGPLKKHRYSEAYSLDQTTKKALSLEIICEI